MFHFVQCDWKILYIGMLHMDDLPETQTNQAKEENKEFSVLYTTSPLKS